MAPSFRGRGMGKDTVSLKCCLAERKKRTREGRKDRGGKAKVGGPSMSQHH